MIYTKSMRVLCSNYKKIKTKWTYLICVRSKSTAEPKTKTYSHTVIFPKTNFPTRSNNAIKENIQKAAQFSELYTWQRENLKGPEYVLHDGPPYANGDLHMGHAVNKITKDINNRSQVLQGNRVHYIPGWDCHGLPIELKALQSAKKSNNTIISSPVDIRNIARKFALETVEKQKEMFKSWGIMADWENQCYLTCDKEYVQKQLKLFYTMYKSGYIYRALKPVYWSPSSNTALAEAELEYDPKYKSREVYVKFPIEAVPQALAGIPGPLSAVIWTTTPWSLVTNRAICYSAALRYGLVTISSRPGEHFIVSTGSVKALEKTFGAEVKVVREFPGSGLEGATYRNGLVDATLPFLAGHHVTEEKGTGLVHIAPAHGPDDFLIAVKNDITVECNVDESGRFTNVHPDLDGLSILKEGQEAVISLLGKSMLHTRMYTHAYPIDWRTKAPVIIRASQQWFIDTARLKEKALKALDRVTILPPSSAEQSRQGFRVPLQKRPYWCISRQRAWGVPIPALYTDSDVIVDERVVDRLCELLETRGADAWWTCEVADLLPREVARDHRLDDKLVTKGKDIMDIWLDSGLSWQTLGGRKAQLYCEGVDQLAAWFQTSLLTAVALNDDAPYESIFVHGFAVDEQKRKMSKSLGNVVDPAVVIHGGGDRKTPAFGVDTLRWWVASHATQHSQIAISHGLLVNVQSEVMRIRKVLKYLLAAVSDLDKTQFEQKPTLNYFDSYMVKETNDFLKEITEHYNSFRYNHVAQTVLYFISNKVSGLYCHCIKDRMYCAPKDSAERISAQLVMNTIFISLSKALGPILPHLVEEAWQHHPLYEKPFYFTPVLPTLSANVDSNIMDTILDIKRDICVMITTKNETLKKFTGTINLNSELYNQLKELNIQDGVKDSVLMEILELSDVKVAVKDVDRWQIELSESPKDQCLRCRKYNAVENSDRCLRCEEIINAFN